MKKLSNQVNNAEVVKKSWYFLTSIAKQVLQMTKTSQEDLSYLGRNLSQKGMIYHHIAVNHHKKSK